MVENQDEFDQKRFILAMVISGIILVVWQFFFAPTPPPPTDDTTQTATQQAGQTPTGQTNAANANVNANPAPVKLNDQPAATAEPVKELPVVEQVIQSDEFKVTLTSAGARVKSVNVIEPAQYAVEGDLLRAMPRDSDHFPFAISFAQNSIALHRGLVWAFVPAESTKKGDTYTRVTYRHTDPGGRFEIDKVYTLKEGLSYVLNLDVVIRNKLDQGVISDRLALDITRYHDPTKKKSMLNMRPDGLEGICKTDSDLERQHFDRVDDPLSYDESPTKWAAVDTRYFLFAAIPLVEGQKCTLERVDEDYLRARIIQPEFAVQPGQQVTVKYELFTGPKDYERLEQVGASLEEAVDYGVLTFLCRPLRWALVLFHGWLGNWGLAIILLTLIIRILTWPINQKVYVNSEKMKELQPKLNEVKEKFKDDQQRQAEETMKIWKEHGVSPLGCLPMFLQFPILLALYYMILNSVELYQANFAFWYVDLSAPDPYFVLPILMGIVMFLQQSFMTVDTPNPQMATMMKVMPLMFSVFMLFLPSGVVLYYFVSLVLGLVQQFWIKRSYRAKAAAA